MKPNALVINVHPSNPHYFTLNGRPTVLVSSDHHYGAVMNLDFDYRAFLDTLQEFGMNVTRIYPGGYVELHGSYCRGNPMGPAPGRRVLPWAATNRPSASAELGGFQLDLDTWNPAYFDRLKDFVLQAEARGIVVEVVFFNGMYDDRWAAQPLYHTNNIQGVGRGDFRRFTTMDDRDLVRYQADYVRKIAEALLEHTNIIYDISDEPEMQRQDSLEWNSVLLDALIGVDGHRHLHGETAHSASPDMTADARTSWIPTEYISPMEECLDTDYDDRKPILNVESQFYPIYYGSHPVEESRVEGWYAMLGGAAGIIHLNSEFSDFNETAEGTTTRAAILPQKKTLVDFMNSLDFAGMTKFSSLRSLPPGAFCRAIAEIGKQYALCLFHGTAHRVDWPQGTVTDRFDVTPGRYNDTVVLGGVPAGTYLAEWIDPSTGSTVRADVQPHVGGDLELATPGYSLDIALRMVRTSG
jgi:hypothetical protein